MGAKTWNCRDEAQDTQDMYDRSGKSATRQQVLIINDLVGNTKGNRAATCCPFLGNI
jgi:mannose/fructose-specific phosphotransferase system component IIA